MTNAITIPDFNSEDVALIKDTICKGATDNELRLFLNQCRATGLNPLARQIYSVERKEKRGDNWVTVRSIQVSIDGFRLIAERSNKYAGQTEPLWCGEDGAWKDVWLSKEPPVAAKIGVLRNDFKEPCWGVARFEAYAQKNKEGKPTSMWAKMGDVMIAKCAEALALRKAFPQELSGLYTADEMEQAANQEIDLKPYEVDKSKPASMFKTNSLRIQYQANIADSLHRAANIEQLNTIITLEKEKFASLRTSGDERDQMVAEGLNNVYKSCLVKLKSAPLESDDYDNDVPAYLREESALDEQFKAAVR